MNCKECQEFILTDYLDNQLEAEAKERIEKHLSVCQECKEFAAITRKATVEPFENSARVNPPESVWRNIQEEISEDQIQSETDWLERLKQILFPKPVFALVTAICLILVILVLVPFKERESVVINTPEQVQEIALVSKKDARLGDVDEDQYVAYLFGDENGYEDYESSIEEFFL